ESRVELARCNDACPRGCHAIAQTLVLRAGEIAGRQAAAVVQHVYPPKSGVAVLHPACIALAIRIPSHVATSIPIARIRIRLWRHGQYSVMALGECDSVTGPSVRVVAGKACMLFVSTEAVGVDVKSTSALAAPM